MNAWAIIVITCSMKWDNVGCNTHNNDCLTIDHTTVLLPSLPPSVRPSVSLRPSLLAPPPPPCWPEPLPALPSVPSPAQLLGPVSPWCLHRLGTLPGQGEEGPGWKDGSYTWDPSQCKHSQTSCECVYVCNNVVKVDRWWCLIEPIGKDRYMTDITEYDR